MAEVHIHIGPDMPDRGIVICDTADHADSNYDVVVYDEADYVETARRLNELFMLVDRMKPTITETYPGLTRFETELMGFIGMMTLHEGIVRPGHLCRLVHISKGALSQVLKSLEQKGFIERLRISDDARGKEIIVSETGKQVLDWFETKRNQFMCDLVHYLGVEEAQHLVQTLRSILVFHREHGFAEVASTGGAS